MMQFPPTEEQLIHRRRLYMLPTSLGWLFSLVLLVLLLGAINYANSLAYGLTFLLAAVAIVSMLHTHRNLLGLRVSCGPCACVFAGENAQFQIYLSNSNGPPRMGICIESGKTEVGRADIAQGEQALVRMEVYAGRRGYLAPPLVVLSSRFPLGFLYAWSRRIRLQQRCLVYPKPGGSLPLPGSLDPRTHEDLGVQPEGEDFRGLREFRPGDSPRHVSWKAVARGRGMLTKQFAGGRHASVWLDWEALPGLDIEQRLSQLCRWVLDCEQAGLQYGLRLPATTLAPANGEPHRHDCLAALALFPAREHDPH